MGIPILQRETLEDADVALLGERDQPALSLIARPSYADTGYQGFSIAVEVAAFDETLNKVTEAGYSVLRGPFSPQDTRLCFVGGPGGIEVELLEAR